MFKKTLHPEKRMRKRRKIVPHNRKPTGDPLPPGRSASGERWKVIEKFEGQYSVSSYGRVRRNFMRGKSQMLLATWSSDDRVIVRLVSPEGRIVRISVKRLVVEAFLPHLRHKRIVHKDGDRCNVAASNLAAYKRSQRKLSEEDVLDIRRKLVQGYSKAELAKQYNVVWETINRIYKRQTWANVIDR